MQAPGISGLDKLYTRQNHFKSPRKNADEFPDVSSRRIS